LAPPVRALVTDELCEWAEGIWRINRDTGFSTLLSLLDDAERETMAARCVSQFESRFADDVGVELVYSSVALLGKERTLELTNNISEPKRSKAMIVLATLLERQQQLEAMRTIENSTKADPSRSVISIAPVAGYADADLLTDLSAVFSSGSYQRERMQFAAALASKGHWLTALRIASTITDDYRKARAYSKLANYAPDSDFMFCIRIALDVGLSMATAVGRNNEGDRAEALSELIPAILRLPRREVLDLWGEILSTMESHPRPEFALKLARFAPVIKYLGGKESVRHVSSALVDVVRWWP
jgi:hypothetical protein